VQQHRLFVGTQLANLVEKQHPLVGSFQQPWTRPHGTGEGPFDMPEQGRHGLIASKRRAIDFDERTAELLSAALELIDFAGESRFAGPRRTGNQQRILTRDGDSLDAFDKRVEIAVARLDSRFEKRQPFLLLLREPGCQRVVFREVQVNDPIFSNPLLLPGWGRRLQQAPGNVPRLGQQKQADLLHVRAGRDVDQVVFVVSAKPIQPRELVKLRKDLVEIPGVDQRDRMQAHGSFRRDRTNIVGDRLAQPLFVGMVQ